MTDPKIKMDGERVRYRVAAISERFAVLIKLFNLRNSFIYTLVDFERKERGATNQIFGLSENLRNPEEAKAVLGRLHSGEIAVSRRNYVPLSESELAQLLALRGKS